MTFDQWVMLFGFAIITVVLLNMWRRTDAVARKYERNVIEIQEVSRHALESLRAHYEQKLKDVETRSDVLEEKFKQLSVENLWIMTENNWLRLVLEKHGLPIPPIPEAMRPKTTDGNIMIHVSRHGDTNVVDVTGQATQVSAGRGNNQE